MEIKEAAVRVATYIAAIEQMVRETPELTAAHIGQELQYASMHYPIVSRDTLAMLEEAIPIAMELHSKVQ